MAIPTFGKITIDPAGSDLAAKTADVKSNVNYNWYTPY